MIGGIIMSGSSKFFFILSGIVSIILGIFLLLNPVTNLIALICTPLLDNQ